MHFSTTTPNGFLPYKAQEAIIRLEGSKLVTSPLDPGAPSKYGWTLTTYRNLINPNATIDDISNLKPLYASHLYYQYFWKRYNIYKINNRKLAISLFLAVVNTSPDVPVKVLQDMTNKYCPQKIKLKVDGILGSKTIYRVNNCKYLWPGYPYLLYDAYSKSRRYAKVWSWASNGLTKRIFYEINFKG